MPTAESNSFSFLGLPAELRNKVYDFAIAGTDETHAHMFRAEMVHVLRLPCKCQGDVARKSSIGLISACQQIRTEFRPLFYKKWHAMVGFSDLLRFLDTFAPEDISFPPLQHITVRLQDHDWDLQKWNLLPLLRAQKRIPNTTWQFNPILDEHLGQASAVGFTCDFLDYIRILHKLGFLDKLELHHCSALYFTRLAEDQNVNTIHLDSPTLYDGGWKIVLQNETGILTPAEQSKVLGYCKILSGLLLSDLEVGDERQGPTEVHVRVSSSEDDTSTEYVLQAGGATMVNTPLNKKLHNGIQVG
jgi:hypothetical protein